MPLGNGHNPSLSDDRVRYRATEHQTAISLTQQRGIGSGSLIVPSGLQPRAPEERPVMGQPHSLSRGVIDGFVKTCQRWQLNERQQLVLLGYADNEFLGRQLLNGWWLQPSQDVKDRVGYVVGISIGLGAIFDEVIEAEVRWLNTGHRKLGNQTPLGFMLGGKMIALMKVSNVVIEERALG